LLCKIPNLQISIAVINDNPFKQKMIKKIIYEHRYEDEEVTMSKHDEEISNILSSKQFVNEESKIITNENTRKNSENPDEIKNDIERELITEQTTEQPVEIYENPSNIVDETKNILNNKNNSSDEDNIQQINIIESHIPILEIHKDSDDDYDFVDDHQDERDLFSHKSSICKGLPILTEIEKPHTKPVVFVKPRHIISDVEKINEHSDAKKINFTQTSPNVEPSTPYTKSIYGQITSESLRKKLIVIERVVYVPETLKELENRVENIKGRLKETFSESKEVTAEWQLKLKAVTQMLFSCCIPLSSDIYTIYCVLGIVQVFDGRFHDHFNNIYLEFQEESN
jgi:hypothetical protein